MKNVPNIILHEKVRIYFKFYTESFEKYGWELIGRVLDNNDSKVLEVDTFPEIKYIPFEDIIEIEYLQGEAIQNLQYNSHLN